MKKILLLLLVLIAGQITAQDVTEKKVKSKIKAVTVFLEKAQINRKASVNLPKGKTLLKFAGLSPYIDAKSIQAKSYGSIMILSVNRQLNYDSKTKRSDKILALIDQKKAIDDKIEMEKTYLKIIDEKKDFLHNNQKISGKNQAVKFTELQQTNQYYGDQISALILETIKHRKTIKKLMKQKTDIQEKINHIADEKEYPTGEILVKVDAKKAGTFKFDLNYIVGGAGWFPSYDIRAKSINDPVKLAYKANVKQDTKVDWNNVKLTFSTANPNISGIAPKLEPYYLDYYSRPKKYLLHGANKVYGIVTEAGTGDPLPGVNIVVQGSTIGTATDFDGKYEISIPKGGGSLVFSYVGFNTVTLPITSNEMNVTMSASADTLDTVVINAAGLDTNNNDDDGGKVLNALSGRVAGVKIKSYSEKPIRQESIEIPMQQIENQVSVSFSIKTPYTVKSNNKVLAVTMENYTMPAKYNYMTIPKIEEKAYLIAHISDWEKYNLLDAEANIFFDGTYVGKTLLETRNAEDELEISLGQDPKIDVSRKVIKDFTTRQFIGNKKEENRGWTIRVKNNKKQKVKIVVYDQVPISKLEEIKISVEELSGAEYDEKTGEVKWELHLSPGKEKTLELKYKVKYPKYRNLFIE